MVRSCVVCRKTAEKQELLRFVLQQCEVSSVASIAPSETRVVLDVKQNLPGRGAYCHCTQRCVGALKVEALLVASLLRAAKQRGEVLAVRHRGMDEVVEEATPRFHGAGVAFEVLKRIRDESRAALEDKRIGKPGRVRL